MASLLMPPGHFPCPACQEPVAFPLDGKEIATCCKCRKTWKAGPYFQEGFRMALANEGCVEMTLWHNRIDEPLAAMLGFAVGFTKALLMVPALLFVVLAPLWIGLELNWLLWAILLVSLYAVLECLGRALPVWFPKDFAATPTTIICWRGLMLLESQPKPVMIPWSAVMKVTYFYGPNQVHLAVDYRSVVGGSSTIILKEGSEERLVDLYESMRMRMGGPR